MDLLRLDNPISFLAVESIARIICDWSRSKLRRFFADRKFYPAKKDFLRTFWWVNIMSTTEPSETTSSSSTSDESKTSLMNGKSRSSAGKKSPIKQIQSPQTCTWCAETKTPLKYVLPTQNGKKEFCSETCIAEFRKAYSKGACIECDNAIRANAPNREFCSTFCLNKNKKKTSTSGASAPSTSQSKSLNNNNSNLSNNNKHKSAVEANNNNTIKEHYAVTKISPMFQYEAFHVFDWKEYLKVSELTHQNFSSIIKISQF